MDIGSGLDYCCRYIKNKWLGRSSVPLPSPAEGLVIFFGASLGMGVVTYLAMECNAPVLVASFGASACLIFCVPTAPFAQPRSVIAGHTIAAVVGVIMHIIFGSTWYAAAFSVSGAIVAMLYSRTLHPPAAATALIAVVTGQSIYYPLYPVALGSTILVLAGKVLNRLMPGIMAAIFPPKKIAR